MPPPLTVAVFPATVLSVIVTWEFVATMPPPTSAAVFPVKEASWIVIVTPP